MEPDQSDLCCGKKSKVDKASSVEYEKTKHGFRQNALGYGMVSYSNYLDEVRFIIGEGYVITTSVFFLFVC